MTNSVNVEFIVDKLLTSLASATDDHFRSDLVNRITQCAERFAPSNAWFVATMVRVFELAGDKVKMSVAQTLMQLIAEGSEDDGDGELSSRVLMHLLTSIAIFSFIPVTALCPVFIHKIATLNLMSFSRVYTLHVI